LEWQRIAALLSRLTLKNLKFCKSKMAARHLEKSTISTKFDTVMQFRPCADAN